MANLLEQISSTLGELNNPQDIQHLVDEALSQNVPVSDIVEKGLRPGLQEVGAKYENGEYFLSELLFAASIINQLMQVLGPKLSAQTLNPKGTILLGTVRGDIHDIGKNIFKMMAESAGFAVIDLGVDVDPDRFVQESRELHPDILGLSCLLTTGLPEIKIVCERLSQANVRNHLKILIGGNAVTRQLACEVGAVAALDAVEGVELCKTIVKT